MSEETNDVNEITPEDFLADEKDTANTESSTEENKNPKAESKESEESKETSEAKGDDPEPKKDETSEKKPDSSEEKEESKESEESESKQKGAEERKEQLNKEINDSKEKLGIDPNTEIRDLVAARNALRDEVAKANSEAYEAASEKDLTEKVNPDTGEKYTSTEAKVEAMRQSQELKEYNERVADAQFTINTEAERVIKDFPIFDEKSDQFNKELFEEARTLLHANLIFDDNTGQIIGSNVSPYSLYKTLANAANISATQGEAKGQQNAEEQMANADTTPSKAPEKKTEDPLTALWKDEL